MSDTARVILWGRDIGAITWLPERSLGVFQYTPEFAESGIQVAPLTMPLRTAPYEFPGLPRGTFLGLPGFLADSLPDRFGNALIDAWLASQGRDAGSFTPVERLCYTGSRGMGALEFLPRLRDGPRQTRRVHLESLVELANRVMDERVALAGRLGADEDQRAVEDILRVGTSAGGARAKAVLAWNPQSGEFRSGQADAPEGFEHWLIKFDGVQGNRDRELSDPLGFGRIEYAYHRMAVAAGITMPRCELLQENGRAHFMVRRFDRSPTGGKLHMQSLGALMHFDFNTAGAYAYEQALQVIQRLAMPMEDMEQQLRRGFFNVLARNQDDHVKNIAFLMDKGGTWRLSPAFDVAYAYNPTGDWTSRHQMTLNGKRDGFVEEDLLHFAAAGGVKTGRAKTLLGEVSEAVRAWAGFAQDAGVSAEDAQRIARTHRRDLMP